MGAALHLQSTEYLTDRDAKVAEHNEYFAFGEPWIDERNDLDNDGRRDYLFPGKEFDPGTNLYYFGARYCDPMVSRWRQRYPPPLLGELWAALGARLALQASLHHLATIGPATLPTSPRTPVVSRGCGLGRKLAKVERILTTEMNLALLKRSRLRPQVGDIFVALPPDGLYVFGRVIAIDANAGGFEGSNLLYVYKVRSKERAVDPHDPLLRGQLLLPPIMTNNLPWSKGYFETVEHRPVGVMDRLPQHCFRDVRGWYFDDKGNRLPAPTEPVGVWGLHSYRTIDDEISKALGIPLAPEDE